MFMFNSPDGATETRTVQDLLTCHASDEMHKQYTLPPRQIAIVLTVGRGVRGGRQLVDRN